MFESKEEYNTLLKREILALEWALKRRITHLDVGVCPNCGAFGHFDIEGLGFAAAVDNPIYYSTVFNRWSCQLCDFMLCS